MQNVFSSILDAILIRLIIPLSLHYICWTRTNGFSLIYYPFFIYSPLIVLHNHSTSIKRVIFFLIILMFTSFTLMLSHVVYTILVVYKYVSDMEKVKNLCSPITMWVNEMGLYDFRLLTINQIITLILLPDPLMCCVSAIILIHFVIRFKKALKKENKKQTKILNPITQSNQSALKITNSFFIQTEFIESIVATFTLISIGAAAIISPSILSLLYFVMFLIMTILWALNIVISKVSYTYLKLFLFFYTGLLCLSNMLYHVPLTQLRKILQSNEENSKLLGFFPLYEARISCASKYRQQIQFKDESRKLANHIYSLLYCLLANQVRRELEKVKWFSHSSTLLQGLSEEERIRINPRSSRKKPNNLVRKMICNLFIENSYILSILAMVIWSVLLSNWFTFPLLLLGCILWTLPITRQACLYISPFLVTYSTVLLCLSFIQGLYLEEYDWHSKLKEIFKRKNNRQPTRLLLYQIICWLQFILSLRLFIRERKTGKQSTFDEKKSELLWTSKIAAMKSFQITIKKLLCKIWVCVCCSVMLYAAINGSSNAMKVVYFLQLFYFLLVFHISYSIWRRQMLAFWWIVVIYSMLAMNLKYVCQFDEIIDLLRKLGADNENLVKFGLESDSIGKDDLIMASLIVVIIFQIHFFHHDFLLFTNMKKRIVLRSLSKELTNDTSDQSVGNRKHYIATLVSGAIHKLHLQKYISNNFVSGINEFVDDVNSAIVKGIEKLHSCCISVKYHLTRFISVHSMKTVCLLLAIFVIKEPSAINLIILVLFLIFLPFNNPFKAFIITIFICFGLTVLANLVFEMTPDSISFLNQTTCLSLKNYRWIGLIKRKNENFNSLVIVWVVVTLFQANHYYRKNLSINIYPKEGIIFATTNYKSFHFQISNVLKLLCNFTFFKMGLEICFVAAVIISSYHLNIFSCFYLLSTYFFLYCGRNFTQKHWRKYIIVVAIVLLYKYIVWLGFPPPICHTLNNKRIVLKNLYILNWFHYPDKNENLDNFNVQKFRMDLIYYILICLQYRAFIIEKRYGTDYGAGSNEPFSKDNLPNLKDLQYSESKSESNQEVYALKTMRYKSYLLFYWIVLGVILFTGMKFVSLFSLFYTAISFALLWMGQGIILKRRRRLLQIWKLIIGYNGLVIFLKCNLHVIGCLFEETFVKNKLCWLVQLLSINCYRQSLDNISAREIARGLRCEDQSLDFGLIWDVICFTFLLLQKRIFESEGFCNLVLDSLVQRKFASRGATLINKVIISRYLIKQKEEQHLIEKIKNKIEKIYLKQNKVGKGIPLLNESFIAIRSGDYYLFDGDASEDDVSSEEDTAIKSNKNELFHKKKPATMENVAKKTLPHLNIPDQNNYNQALRVPPKVVVSLRQTMVRRRFLTRYTIPRLNKAYQVSEKRLPEPVKCESKPKEEKKQPEYTNKKIIKIRDRRKKKKSHIEEEGLTTDYNEIIQTQEESPIKQSLISQNSSQSIVASKIISKFLFKQVYSKPVSYYKAKRTRQKKQFTVYSPGTVNKDCWHSVKNGVRSILHYLQNRLLLLIDWIYDYTREDRLLRAKLENEKHVVKLHIVKNFSYSACQITLLTSQSDVDIEEIVDQYCEVNIPKSLRVSLITRTSMDTQPGPIEQHLTESQNLNRLIISLYSLYEMYSHIVCFCLMILLHIQSQSLFTIVYPHIIFLWGLLSVPRTTKRFWILTITYSEILILLRYVCQFKFVYDEVKNWSTYTQYLFDLHKSTNHSTYHIIVLMFVFFQRALLKNKGLWKIYSIKAPKIKNTSNSRDEKKKYNYAKFKNNIATELRRFKSLFYDSKYKEKKDLYSSLFALELFVLFLFVIDSSPVEISSTTNNSLLTEASTEITGSRLFALILQFVCLLTERAIYIRRNLVAKFVFLVLQMIFVHIWMFIIFPYYRFLEDRNHRSGASFYILYVTKCIYFGLSAYQIRSGYPIRTYVVTKSSATYSWVRMLLMKLYFITPFLYELHNLVDWTSSRSSLCMGHFMTLRNIYYRLYIVKCWRQYEMNCPSQRGIYYKPFSLKFVIGGSFILFIAACIWFPFMFLYFKTSLSNSIIPFECGLKLRFIGYPTLYETVVAIDRSALLKHEDDIDLLQCFNVNDENTTPSGTQTDFCTKIDFNTTGEQVWPVNHEILKKEIYPQAIYEIVIDFDCKSIVKDNKGENIDLKIHSFAQLLKLDVSHRFFEFVNNDNMTKFDLDIPNSLPLFIDRGNTMSKKKNTHIHLALKIKKEKENEIIRYLISLEKNYDKINCLNKNFDFNRELKNIFIKNNKLSALSIIIENERTQKRMIFIKIAQNNLIQIFVVYIIVLFNKLRKLYGDLYLQIHIEEIPNPDRLLNIINEIALVRENEMYPLEEELFAKLLFLFRSFETLVKWTRHKRKVVKHFQDNTIEKKKNNRLSMRTTSRQ